MRLDYDYTQLYNTSGSSVVTVAIRHYNEPVTMVATIADHFALTDPAYKVACLTDTLGQKQGVTTTWQWLNRALDLDCDYIIHTDCDTLWQGRLDLAPLVSKGNQPAILAAPATNRSFTFSTGVMVLNRAARELIRDYLATYKPNCPCYWWTDKTTGDRKLVASVDKMFSQLASELGVEVIYTEQIQWQHTGDAEQLAAAKLMPGVVAIGNAG